MIRGTLAQREPLSIGTAVPRFSAAATALAIAGAATAAVVDGGLVRPVAEVAALALVTVAGGVVTVGSGPFLAPFRAWTHGLVLTILLLAIGLDTAARVGAGAAALPGLAPVAVPMLSLALAMLRPPRHVLAGGLVLAIAAGALTLALAGPGSGSQAFAATAACAVPAVAAAALGRVALLRLDPPEDPPARPEPPPAVQRSVQQEAVDRLQAEALPLIERVRSAGAVTREDAERARRIADGLRTALLADLARGWLTEVGVTVDDPHGYAERTTADQRMAVRTVLTSLPLADPGRPGTARVTGQDRDAELVLELPLSARPQRRELAPLIPLVRAAFAVADLRLEEERAILVAAWAVED